MAFLKTRSILSEAIKTAAFVLVFAAIFLMLTEKISDPDFWWHLKTGQWIWQNKSLPSEDPFSYTVSKIADPARKKLVLTQYWLSQLILYAVYSTSGFQGIIFFRAFLLCGMFLFVYFWMKQSGMQDLSSLFFTLIASMIVIKDVNYIGDRPQIWSSFFFPVVVYILEGTRAAFGKSDGDNRISGQTSRWILPPIMLLWANLHGGFILGMAVIVLYTALGIFSSFSIKGQRSNLKTNFFAANVLSVAVCFINPNTYHAIISSVGLTASEYTRGVAEFQSPLYDMFHFGNLYLWYLCLFAASVIAIVSGFKKMPAGRLILLLGLILMSLTAKRYIIFFATAGAVFCGIYFSPMLRRFNKPIGYATAVFSLYLIISGFANGSFLKKDFRRNDYPVKAAGFLKENDVRGNMFNYYDWGGFLIWELGPEKKVFIDGRTTQFEIFAEYLNTLNDTDKLSLQILDAYGINYIIIPACNEITGDINPIVFSLLSNNSWALVYADEKAFVSAKDNGVNELLIKRYSLNKERIWDHLIAYSGRRLRTQRAVWYFNIAYSYEMKGDKEKAAAWYDEALNRARGKEKEHLLKKRDYLRQS